MTLFYVPGACSMAPHIVLREAGFDFGAESVDLRAKTWAGGDYKSVNPKGSVPALKLDDGQVLTEVAVLVQYIADQKPQSNLIPKFGTMERYRLQEWLNFISAELHKGFGPFWNPSSSAEAKEAARTNLARRFDHIEGHLKSHPYLMGETFSVADAYLFTILGWADLHKVDLSAWPQIQAFRQRVAARPKVMETLKAEGLMK